VVCDVIIVVKDYVFEGRISEEEDEGNAFQS
jgi:hypothetical protein